MLTITEQPDGTFEAVIDGIGKVGVQVATGLEDRSVTVIFRRNDFSIEVSVPARDAVNFAQRLLDAGLPIGADTRAARRGFEQLKGGKP
jgi:hypothetical protein